MSTSLSESFAPLEAAIAHTLILGTMPGQASLRAAQYYAHPRNAFWPIMLSLADGTAVDVRATMQRGYTSRCERLTEQGYALWDVLARCHRPGSLDSRIERRSEVANDIVALVERHPELQCIACNGRTAEKLLKRHSLPGLNRLQSDGRQLRIVTLPSSSPAMASLSLAEKRQRWAEGLLGCVVQLA
jgi:hypoxanthine-DNA glycosylase